MIRYSITVREYDESTDQFATRVTYELSDGQPVSFDSVLPAFLANVIAPDLIDELEEDGETAGNQPFSLVGKSFTVTARC